MLRFVSVAPGAIFANTHVISALTFEVSYLGIFFSRIASSTTGGDVTFGPGTTGCTAAYVED